MARARTDREDREAEFAYSVVIPTKDRPDGLDRALHLVCEQTEKPAEIVVVDASEPPLEIAAATRRMVADAGISLRSLTHPPSTARQRNAGIDVVTTPLVFLLDDDVVIDPDYVASLLRRWRSKGLTAISGISGYAIAPEKSLLSRTVGRTLRAMFMLHVGDKHGDHAVIRRSGKLRYGLAIQKDVVVPAIGAGACLFRTELVRRHRFSERFDGYVLGEDLDLSLRVSQDAPVIGTSERFEHHHATGGKHSPIRWYYRGRPETYFRLRNRHLTGLSYPAFWLSVFAEGCMALLESLRERDHRHVANYALGVRRSVSDVRREQFAFHSGAHYRARALYDRSRFSVRRLPADSPLSPGIRILGYHRVSRGDPLCVAPETLRRQLETALARGMEPISLTRALDLLEGQEPLERSYLVTTFDDGYLDNLEDGLPILDELAIPATLFLVTAIADGREGFYWYRRNPPAPIRWSDARALAGHPLIDFQPHGRFHRRLTALSEADARDEIAGAKDDIERELGTVVTTFCYASGTFDDREAGLVREAGYRGALASRQGINQPGQDMYRLGRVMVSRSDDDKTFGQKLSAELPESRLEHWLRERHRVAPVTRRG